MVRLSSVPFGLSIGIYRTIIFVVLLMRTQMDIQKDHWHHLEMTSFTLDTNCLIDMAEDWPAAAHIRALLAAGANGEADLALVASSASERQQGGTFLASVAVFEERRNALGFNGLPLLPSIGRWDVSFFGHSVWGSEDGSAREAKIYSLLFPTSPVEWAECAAAKGADVNDLTSPAGMRWRNQMLDAQALWAHDHAGRDVFVTSDQRLRVLNDHPDFPAMTIRTPEEAVALLQ